MAHTKGGIRLAFQDDEYQIVYASDDGYAEALGVSLTSLFENNQDAKSIQVTILDSGISSKNQERIKEVCKRYNRSLPKWIEAVDIEKRLSINVNVDRGSISQYARIFLSKVFGSNISRVLYLDCDTIVVASLYDLWNLQMDGNIIAALKDAFSSLYRQNLGLQKNDIMFNSGVMLIDLEKWGENNIESKVLNFILSKNGKVQQGDQGALNAILAKRTKVLPPEYNMISLFYDLSYKDITLYRKPVDFYSEKEINQGKQNPVIIHFTSSFYNCRPWIIGTQEVEATRWLKYKNMSPWKKVELYNDRRAGVNKMLFFLYNHTSPKFVLMAAGCFQIYLRPLKNKLLS